MKGTSLPTALVLRRVGLIVLQEYGNIPLSVQYTPDIDVIRLLNKEDEVRELSYPQAP